MIDAVATLWAGNRSLSEIAEAVGVSRSQIAGAVWRARKAGDTRFAPRPSAPKPKPTVKARDIKPVAEALPASPAKHTEPVRFVDLRPGRCRWPINDAPRGEMHLLLYCGQPVATRGGNYCSRHAALTHARQLRVAAHGL
jgi:hypothetical protein